MKRRLILTLLAVFTSLAVIAAPLGMDPVWAKTGTTPYSSADWGNSDHGGGSSHWAGHGAGDAGREGTRLLLLSQEYTYDMFNWCAQAYNLSRAPLIGPMSQEGAFTFRFETGSMLAFYGLKARVEMDGFQLKR